VTDEDGYYYSMYKRTYKFVFLVHNVETEHS